MKIGPAFIVCLGPTVYMTGRDDTSILFCFLFAIIMGNLAGFIDKDILREKYMWRLW